MQFQPDDITEAERTQLWNKFEHEETLMSELEYYQDKVRAMRKPETALDRAVLAAFELHLNNLKGLLTRLYDGKPPRCRVRAGGTRGTSS